MILKVKFKANYPSEGIRTMRLTEVIRQETPDGRDTHAVFEPEAFKENETLCEGFFLPETNARFLTPEMRAMLKGMETLELPRSLRVLRKNVFYSKDPFVDSDRFIPKKIILFHPLLPERDALRSVEIVQVLDKVFLLDTETYFRAINNLEVVNSDGDVVGRFDTLDLLRYWYGIQKSYPITSPEKYDEYLYSFRTPINGLEITWKYSMIIDRLNLPFGLKEEIRQKFLNYLRTNKENVINWLLNSERVGDIQKYAGSLITKSNFDKVLENANKQNNIELAAFLLEFKESNLKADQDKTKTLKVKIAKPVDASSFREIQKEWALTDVSEPQLTLSGRKMMTLTSPGTRSGVLTLPTCAGNKPITKIGFNCNLHAEEVVVPEGYRIIEKSAFSMNRGGRKFYIADSVEVLGETAFWNCDQLTEIRLSDRVERIESKTFRGCTNLTLINLPADLVFIGERAFQKCLSLDKLEISGKVTKIEDKAFLDCPKLVIHAPKGSYAIEYARENGVKYVEV